MGWFNHQLDHHPMGWLVPLGGMGPLDFCDSRNTQFLHEAASHICRGIDMLKPLALWRCASAYNAMMVNNKVPYLAALPRFLVPKWSVPAVFMVSLRKF